MYKLAVPDGIFSVQPDTTPSTGCGKAYSPPVGLSAIGTAERLKA